MRHIGSVCFWGMACLRLDSPEPKNKRNRIMAYSHNPQILTRIRLFRRLSRPAGLDPLPGGFVAAHYGSITVVPSSVLTGSENSA